VQRTRSIDNAYLNDTAPSPVVVVADHNDDTRLLYADAFRRDGWIVVEATDGRDALVAVLTERASLLVADARLPFIDGFTLCELLRQDEATRGVAVLMIVSDANAASVVRVTQCGASAIVTRAATTEMVVAEGCRVFGEAPSGMQRDAAAREKEAGAASEARRAVSSDRVKTPRLVCPFCRRPLDFEATHTGGTGREIERWDRLVCNGGGCGDFEYSHRTRTLRPA
jgi:PleD family two-component response regulator